MSLAKNIAIIANGEPPNADFVKEILADVHTIIAADNGANLCRNLNIIPDVIIGDLDSVSSETLKRFPDSEIIYRPDQSINDLSKALEYAKAASPRLIKIIALWGRRNDHVISNLLIAGGWDSDIPLIVYDDYGKMTFLNAGRHQLKGRPGKTVSFFSLGAIKNLTLAGFRYELNNADYTHSFNGLSNVYERMNVSVEFSKGRLIVYDVYQK